MGSQFSIDGFTRCCSLLIDLLSFLAGHTRLPCPHCFAVPRLDLQLPASVLGRPRRLGWHEQFHLLLVRIFDILGPQVSTIQQLFLHFLPRPLLYLFLIGALNPAASYPSLLTSTPTMARLSVSVANCTFTAGLNPPFAIFITRACGSVVLTLSSLFRTLSPYLPYRSLGCLLPLLLQRRQLLNPRL